MRRFLCLPLSILAFLRPFLFQLRHFPDPRPPHARAETPSNARISNKFPCPFSMIRVHQKYEQSPTDVRPWHNTSSGFRRFSYVGARAKFRARKQLFEAWTAAEVHASFVSRA
jgi:hypothetical protein